MTIQTTHANANDVTFLSPPPPPPKPPPPPPPSPPPSTAASRGARFSAPRVGSSLAFVFVPMPMLLAYLRKSAFSPIVVR